MTPRSVLPPLGVGALMRGGERGIFLSQGDTADFALDGVGIEFDLAILKGACQSRSNVLCRATDPLADHRVNVISGPEKWQSVDALRNEPRRDIRLPTPEYVGSRESFRYNE